MFDSPVEQTVVLTGVASWFAHGWYLNERLKSVRAKLDAMFEQFNGLREYLYAIDPQFDDERASLARVETHMEDPSKGGMFAGMDNWELLQEKRKAGKRTLNTPFVPPP